MDIRQGLTPIDDHWEDILGNKYWIVNDNEKGKYYQRVEYKLGGSLWFEFPNILHRLDGPATTYHKCSSLKDAKLRCMMGCGIVEEWWFHGTQVNCTNQEEFEKLIQLKAFW